LLKRIIKLSTITPIILLCGCASVLPLASLSSQLGLAAVAVEQLHREMTPTLTHFTGYKPGEACANYQWAVQLYGRQCRYWREVLCYQGSVNLAECTQLLQNDQASGKCSICAVHRTSMPWLE
jgi:hypothetical protein